MGLLDGAPAEFYRPPRLPAALPKEVRPALHSVVVESLRSMGKADDMSEDGFRHLPPPLGNAHNYPNTASQCTLDYDLRSLRSV